MKIDLRRLAEIQIGYQPKGSVEDDPAGTHFLIQSRDCPGDGDIRWDELCRIVPTRRNPERYTLRDGDVLFLAKGGRRTAAAVRSPRSHTMAVSTFYILRVSDEEVVLPEYLAWYLNNAATDYLAAEARQGTTIPFISVQTLAGMPVELPPTRTQQRVVAMDALLRQEQRLTSKILERRGQLVTALSKRAIAESEG
jgi:hypothetical protein